MSFNYDHFVLFMIIIMHYHALSCIIMHYHALSCIIMIHGNHGAYHEGFEVLKNTFLWIREKAARLGHRHNHGTCEIMSHGESVVDFGRMFRRIHIYFAFFPSQHISIFKHFHFGLRCVSGWMASPQLKRSYPTANVAPEFSSTYTSSYS